MTPHRYCALRAASSGSSFYYAFLFLPSRKKRAIQALYAFCREVDDCADGADEQGEAEVRLAAWRDEIKAVFAGTPHHPVGKALAAVRKDFDLPQGYLLEIINGVEMDLYTKRYSTFGELQLYCYRVASAVGLLAIEIFGYQDPRTRQYAYNLGIAFQLTNILRDLREDAARDRIYLPLEDLRSYGLSEQDILEGRSTPAYQQLLEFELERARRFYDRALQGLPEADRPDQLPGLIMAAIYQRTLEELSVHKTRGRLTGLQKLMTAWRAYRAENRRARKAY